MRAIVMAVGLAAWAGSAAAATLDIPAGTPFPVPGTGLTAVLVAVTDFRCPSDLDCYWEGEKRVTITIAAAAGGDSVDIVLCNQCEGATDRAVAMGVTFAFGDLLPPVKVIEALGRPALVADYSARVTTE
jgi:hypothetical protein